MAIRKPFDYAPHVIRYHGDLLELTDSADHPQYLGTMAGVFSTGRYYNGNAVGAGTSVTYPSVLNRLDAQMFFVRDTTSFDRIGLNTTSSGTFVTRLGVYKGDGTNYTPSSLVLDAGTFIGGGANEISISLTLTPGLYYLARVSDTALINWTASGTSSGISTALLGGSSVSNHWNASSIFTVSGVDPALPLPNPFGTATGRVGPFTVSMRVA
jgi:hypothetical protein